MENGKAQAANFPFCTIEPNVGIVAVPDSRLHVLSDLSKSQRAVPASIELGLSRVQVKERFFFNFSSLFLVSTNTCLILFLIASNMFGGSN